MAKSNADRNLLFGLLALQTGLIQQSALLVAFHAWTQDKRRALAEILVEQGALDGDGQKLIHALAEKHLKMQGGDPERSLASIYSTRAIREGLARLDDPEIEASLGHASDSTEDSDPDRTRSLSVGSATSAGQRFHILRPHARGGLGAVFVAMDEELHREVALKQILDHHADDPTSRARFLVEAEITGGLEHPGIVPVYGLGTYADGRPFYAMRFVRGESLKEAIERFHGGGSVESAVRTNPGSQSAAKTVRTADPTGLELRRLLRRFIDVCNAIEYAHSRGILHRDIKPGNVILGKHGETLIVDWGLAKPVGRNESGKPSDERTLIPSSASGSAETLPGSAMGTPAYMSPEQAAGALDRLGPRSDVYSLGATLYGLLTGQPPFLGDDVGAVLQAVQKGEIPPPRRLEPSVDQAMEAICLKAMALRPEDRYASPRALADDLERWMADEPVTAWREPFSRRTRRWARRNRTVVATASVAVLVALAGTATVLAVQTRANRELRASNTQTLQERDLARQNFDLARKAVDDYLTRVGQNPLLREQGLHDLRQELLEAALGYYRDCLLQQGDNPTVQADAAAAHERVGDILIELGRFGNALAAYNQALALIVPLVRDAQVDPTTATARVRLEAGRLQALKDGGWYPEAIAAFDRTSRLGEALLATDGGTEDLPNIFARTNLNAAVVLRNTGRVDDALAAAMRGHELAVRATRDRPGDPAAARTRLFVSIIASEMLQAKGRYGESRLLCDQAVTFGKAHLREHPRDVEVRLYLATLLGEYGEAEKFQGHPLEALAFIRESADTLGALARENPLLIRIRSHWASKLTNLSFVQFDLGQYAEAARSARASIDVNEALSREVPSSPFFRRKAGWGYGALGKALLKEGSRGEGLAMLRKAVAILETSDDVWDLYNLACYLAVISTVPDPEQGPRTTERQRQDAGRAVAAIRRDITLGFTGSAALKNDPDFDSLRSRPDFQALLMDLDFPADPFAP